MNSSISHSIAWCALQVSLVAFSGVMFSILVSRRNSLTACAIVCRAAAVCVLLTILAPLPVHHLFVLGTDSATTSPGLIHSVVPGGDDTSGSTNGSIPPIVPMVNLRDLALAARSLTANIGRYEKRGGPVVQTLVWAMLAAIAIGHLRLAAGIAFIRQLRLSGTSINDRKLFRLLNELATLLKCGVVPKVRESPEITDAAVAGWIRPTLMLPLDWRHWTDDERRSVIAHELAHIVRRDAMWRAAASSVLAIHFYNPFVHWLLRRVVFYQELSADATAANVVGRRLYLDSLSSLAIRHDNRLMKDGSAGLLPVFSGHLIRRIKMLHSKDGRTDVGIQGKPMIASAVISTAFLVMGLAALATRGIAQSPGEEPKARSPVFGSVSFTKSVVDAKSDSDPTRGLFHRVPLAYSTMGANNQIGMATVRVRELLAHPEVAPYAPVLGGLAASALEMVAKCQSTPKLDLSDIEWIALQPAVTFKAATPETKSQFMIGSTVFQVKLSHPVDLRQWFEKFAPDTPRHVVEGTDVFQLTSDLIGPYPCYIWVTDTTILHLLGKEPEVITPQTKLADLNSGSGGLPTSGKFDADVVQPGAVPKWPTVWNRADNGLVSIVIAKADISGLLSDFDNRKDLQGELALESVRALRALQTRCLVTAIGFDLGAGTSQVGMRVSLKHSSRDSAIQSMHEIQELLAAAKPELAKKLADLEQGDSKDREELNEMRFCVEALETMTISTDDYEDGTAAVVISAAVPCSTLIGLGF